MQFLIKSFAELTNIELYNIIRLRNEVFVVEQDCPYQDADGKDLKALHLFCKENGSDNILAYCRLLPAGISYTESSIGRVVNSMSVRKTGLGRTMMQQAINFIHNEWKERTIRISAQLYLKSFYESLGFTAFGEVYPEDNIPHIGMIRIAQ